MNAGRLLRETGYDTDALRVRIAPVDPSDINVWPAAPFFRRLWRTGIRAMTQGKMIFVDPELMTGHRDELARLVVHELIHVRQYVAVGYVGFTVRYLIEYWKGRVGGKSPAQAYRDIPYELEARQLAERTISSV